jgi:hypothetical protein
MNRKLDEGMPISINDQVAHANLWPTPTAGRATQEMSPSQEKRNSLNLAQTVQVNGGMWPTPTAQDFKKRGPNSKQQGLNETARAMWLTPMSSEGKRSEMKPETLKKGKELGNLSQQMAHQTQRGNLNPDWVESLMGFPPGWTLTDGPPCSGRNSTTGSHQE